MKYTLYYLALVLTLLSACGNEKQETQTPGTDTVTTRPDTTVAQAEVKQNNTPTDRELQDINWFDIYIGHPYLDSLHIALANDPNTEVFVKKDICGGDYCYSYRTIKDNKKHLTLHFFKGDTGEYGFDNALYVLKGKELYMVRHFDIDMENLDSTGTVWRTTEKIYAFGPQKVTVQERTASTRDYNARINLLNKLPFTTKEMDKTELVKSESTQLKADLERETEME
jgi:hypothetical protein